MVVNDSRGKEVEQDVNLDCTQRYRRICHELIQIAAEASNTVEGYELVKDTANELRLKLGDIRNPVDCLDMPILTDFSNDIYDGLRLKHKEKSKRGGRRLKSWVEKQGKGKKKSGGPSNSQRLQNQQPTTAPTPTHMMDNIDPSYMSFMDSISHISSQASAAHQLLDEDYI
ncbi:uncharacterized protein LOC122071197 [Macadamia integrifolia]|uniref:uncharacterized protein LOC122071197 n=1 Tax=Macadamia integrifolia TaxID=60698 RepID=UPI001C4E8A07|nr:uncharacterized protein LOC122071197 [Macadamia integrifolia]